MSARSARRWRSLALVTALAAWGCDEAPKRTAPGEGGDGGARDAARQTDGTAGDRDARVAPPDAGLDADLPDAAPPDLGPGGEDAGDAAPPDAGFDPALVPDRPHVAVADLAEVAYVVWYLDGRLWVRRLEADGAWHGPAVVRAELPEPPLALTALGRGGVPWIAYAPADGGPVRLLPADLPDEPATTLDVHGRPLLAAAGDRLLVVGQAADGSGRTAWQFVGDGGRESEPPIVDPLGLPPPDDALGITGGVLLRYAEAGQCLQLDPDGRIAGSTRCGAGAGHLVGRGARSLVVRRETDADGVAVYRVGPAIGAEDEIPFRIGGVVEGQPPFPPAADRLVLVTRGMRNGPLRDRVHLSVVGPDGLFEATEGAADWAWPGARAAVPRGEVVHLVVFGAADGPHVRPVAVRPFPFEGPAFGFSRDPGCAPAVEVCDGLDQDCDGQPDDGLCCADDENSVVDGFDEEDRLPELPAELLVSGTTYNGANALKLALRLDDAGQWWSYKFHYYGREDVLRYDAFDYPTEGRRGRAFVAAGVLSLLVTEDDDGELHGLWHSRPEDDPTVPTSGQHRSLPCDRLLGAMTLSETRGQERILLVCGDRLVVTSGRDDFPDRVYEIPDLAPGGAAWMTYGWRGTGLLELLMAHDDAGGSRRLGIWRVVLGADRLPSEVEAVRFLPGSLQGLGSDALADPIWILQPAYEVALQVGPDFARYRVHRGNGFTWTDIRVGTVPDRVVFSPARRRLFIGGPLERGGQPGVGIWVVEFDRDDATSATWPIRPTFFIPDPDVRWAVHEEAFGREVVTVRRDPAADGGWRAEGLHARCRAR